MKLRFPVVLLSALFLSACGGSMVPSAPNSASHFTADGIASYYGDEYQGRLTANGERFDQNKLTAAHRTLPFNTVVRVTDPATGRQVAVRINDRGPFVPGRVIDLSRAAAERLGILQRGVAPVRLEILD
ncbi:septal ring lytic transglycosylase RlpA family protein [Stakelama tenebrarum]|uniref:Endolytic peptidoglycan transglycosylase RlpA n=1 Tax=Stakelama tenebrarum TaxID=2711215 RepID=A0A6G6Y1A8_9SPHN|nr:septal ring lytic transglycosylase RlpA family protein [Sphingosinithalassobacter tenebrarum]QIG78393.1 septal ring lytic transglycosylase RlpA family protein [Sphingosinithalassobacter tenebrarum]